MAYIAMACMVRAYILMACLAMAYGAIAYTGTRMAMACRVMALIVMAYMVMAYVFMAYILMACKVMACICTCQELLNDRGRTDGLAQRPRLQRVHHKGGDTINYAEGRSPHRAQGHA